jgi:hypothetical protein
MSNNFRVGQKVVCVPDWSGKYNQREMHPGINWPVVGEVYTVAAVTAFPASPGGEPIDGLALVEIPNERFGQLMISGWAARDFQPAKFNEINISIFTRMLTDNRVDA